jgi:hypothetical protein
MLLEGKFITEQAINQQYSSYVSKDIVILSSAQLSHSIEFCL